ncbi:sulfatase, partial [Acidobacteriota bacterium]
MTRYRTLTGILVCALFFSSCGPKSPEPASSFRFIDALSEENIVRSPLRDTTAPLEGPDIRYPTHSAPLDEAGISSNPLDLKRRLRLGGTERNTLFAPPGSEYAFEVTLTADSVLEFAVGIVREAAFTASGQGNEVGGAGVDFRVELEIQGRKRTLFQEYMTGPPAAEEPGIAFAQHRLDLPYEAEEARLSFVTRGESPCFSFWANPILFRQESSGLNVILISVDTLRADHLGSYGYSRDTSPHIDALAEDGIRFANAYSSSSWTLPSHVSLMTSLHGVRHQVYHDDERMDPGLVTLAEHFQSRGYSCAAFTGGGFVSPAYGFAKGFDTYDVGSGHVLNQDSADRVYRFVSPWIDRHKDRSFFLFLHTYQPHSPYACPMPYKTMFLNDDSLFGHADLFYILGGQANLYKSLPDAERQNLIDLYDGEIRYVDDRLIGPLVAQLKAQGLYDRTLIVFLSDHGEEFFDHGAWGHGHSLYDELLKVPLILKLPKSQHKGMSPDTIVSLVDVMPTLLDAMGWDIPRESLDGRSLFPVIEGREREDRMFLADIGSNILRSHVPKKIATNRGRIKMILNEAYSPEALEFFRFPPPRSGPAELFDLAADPAESRSLADRQPGLANDILRWINDFY